MCTGLELAGLVAASGLSAAGSAMSAQKANDQQTIFRAQQMQNDANVRNAMNAERDATLRRTDQLDEQSRATFDRLLNKQSEPETQQRQQQAEAERMQTFEQVMPRSTAGEIPLRGSAPQMVRDSADASLASAVDRAKRQIQANARVGSFADMLGGNAIDQSQAANQIGMFRGFADRENATLKDRQSLAGAAVDRSGEIRQPTQSVGLGEVMVGAGNLLGRTIGAGNTGLFSRFLPAQTGAPLELGQFMRY